MDEQLANKFRDGIAKDDLPDVVERLENELEVVKWIMKLHSIAHRKSGVSPTAEDGLWDKIIEHYPEISDGLNEQLKHMQVLVNLRILLGHKDSQNPWKKPTVQWWDGANFETVNAHQ